MTSRAARRAAHNALATVAGTLIPRHSPLLHFLSAKRHADVEDNPLIPFPGSNLFHCRTVAKIAQMRDCSMQCAGMSAFYECNLCILWSAQFVLPRAHDLQSPPLFSLCHEIATAAAAAL